MELAAKQQQEKITMKQQLWDIIVEVSWGKVYTDVKEANLELGDFYPKILLNKGSFIETTMYYKILED